MLIFLFFLPVYILQGWPFFLDFSFFRYNSFISLIFFFSFCICAALVQDQVINFLPVGVSFRLIINQFIWIWLFLTSFRAEVCEEPAAARNLVIGSKTSRDLRSVRTSYKPFWPCTHVDLRSPLQLTLRCRFHFLRSFLFEKFRRALLWSHLFPIA